ncbi:hydrogen peroxide-inducible genes activator [Silanimonas lenta]|uniref:hydrogen peroxide-inducible genes activator n=1 Tax=Silanimonas lenta TaxID=265429 RepID=UPI002FE2B792
MSALPSLQQLKFLAALDEHGHFGRAASAVGVGTPALSTGIAALETMLGLALAERSRRRVQMTPAGKRLAEQARQVLRATHDFLDLARAESRPMAGRWRFGSIPTIAPFLMPRLLPALKGRFPELQLELKEAKTPELLDELGAGSLDLLLIAFPYRTPGCETMPLFLDSYLFACSPRCPLARREAIGPDELLAQPLMLLDPSNCLHHHALPPLEDAAASPRATFSGTSLQTLAAMVAVDMGSTLLPRLAVEGGLLRGARVVTRPLAYPGGKRSIGLAWRKGSHRAEHFRRLGQAIQAWALEAGIGEPLPAGRSRRAGAGRKTR